MIYDILASGGYIIVPIVGVTFESKNLPFINRQEVMSRYTRHTLHNATLCEENDNQYDTSALRVDMENGNDIGYIPNKSTTIQYFAR